MTGDYEGVHAFLFLHKNDPVPPADVIGAVEQYKGDGGPVFFAAEFRGDFAGFVHFAADTLEELMDFKDHELFDAGVRSDYVAEGTVLGAADAQPKGPKRHSPRYCAICRVRTTETPDEVLDAIAEAFDETRRSSAHRGSSGVSRCWSSWGATTRRARGCDRASPGCRRGQRGCHAGGDGRHRSRRGRNVGCLRPVESASSSRCSSRTSPGTRPLQRRWTLRRSSPSSGRRWRISSGSSRSTVEPCRRSRATASWPSSGSPSRTRTTPSGRCAPPSPFANVSAS